MSEKNSAKSNIEKMGHGLLKDVREGKNPSVDVPIRALSNIKFNPTTRMIEMGLNKAKRFFFNVAHVRSFVQTMEAAATAKELIEMDKHLSLRQVFYRMKRTIPGTEMNIVDEQEESNKAIEDLELIVDSPREKLHINANKNGSVAGKVIIEDHGDTIDWSKLGSGGWSIPSNVEDIKFKKVNAKFIIYMEKAAEWESLHEHRVWEKQDCVIMASQGQATRGVRRLLQRLSLEFNLPVYILVDGDPWGMYIYSVLKYGSISLAHMSESLTIPNAKMLGMTADDVTKYNLKRHIIKFKDIDKSRLKQLKGYDWFKSKEWQTELGKWEKLGGKVELAALTANGISFMAEKYLPDKIKNKDWLD
jgi:DNA topoisomerase-6 subunit A